MFFDTFLSFPLLRKLISLFGKLCYVDQNRRKLVECLENIVKYDVLKHCSSNPSVKLVLLVDVTQSVAHTSLSPFVKNIFFSPTKFMGISFSHGCETDSASLEVHFSLR